MATKSFVPLLGKRLRLTKLDACGTLPASATPNAIMVSNGFITLSLSAETEDGSEIVTKKADGTMCVNEKSSDSFKRFTMEIEFCGVNPAMLAMVSNAKPYEDYAGDIAGLTIGEGPIEAYFGLELWTGMAGGACIPGAETAGGYVLLPFMGGGMLGDIEINGEDPVNFSVAGAYSKGGNQWGVGPYEVLGDGGVASPLPTPLDPFDHLLLVDTSIAPPPEASDPQPMP